MDEHHLTTDNTQHSKSTPNEDHNNNNIVNQLTNKLSNTQDTESMSSEVAQSQLCCSCRYEKAVFICTVCNESGLAANNFASSEKIANKTAGGAENNNSIYFSPSNPTSPNAAAENENQDEDKIPDAEVLMRSKCSGLKMV